MATKKIEFCCSKENGLLNVCHHNLKVDDKKCHLIDAGCRWSKDDIKKIVEDDLYGLNDGWYSNCDSEECEEL